MSNYPENELFGSWTPEQQREFKIATRVDEKPWEWRLKNEWLVGVTTKFVDHFFYRLAPVPEIDDSVDWSHVHPDYVRLHRGAAGHPMFYPKNGSFCLPAEHFASYKRGNKPSSTIYRPGFEPNNKHTTE